MESEAHAKRHSMTREAVEAGHQVWAMLSCPATKQGSRCAALFSQWGELLCSASHKTGHQTSCITQPAENWAQAQIGAAAGPTSALGSSPLHPDHQTSLSLEFLERARLSQGQACVQLWGQSGLFAGHLLPSEGQAWLLPGCAPTAVGFCHMTPRIIASGHCSSP